MGHFEKPRHSFDAVRQAILAGEGFDGDDLRDDIERSVMSDAYKNGAVQEPIYGRNRVIAAESLARPSDDTFGDYSIGELSQEFYARGLAEKFDTLTSSIGIKYARQFPATLNISVESALSPKFWDGIQKRAENFEPEHFIFEILEHDVDVNADISHLRALKERGYRFALDDYAGTPEDKHRLAVFGDLVDYIKVDGPLVRAGLGDTEMADHSVDEFVQVLARLQTDYPDIELIAERVRTAEEAQTLFDMGFTGVQGRQLKPQFFEYTPEAKALAL